MSLNKMAITPLLMHCSCHSCKPGHWYVCLATSSDNWWCEVSHFSWHKGRTTPTGAGQAIINDWLCLSEQKQVNMYWYVYGVILWVFHQAPVPLSIFRSNSKFDENSKHRLIGWVYSKLERSEFSSNFEFDRNMLSGTGARTAYQAIILCITGSQQSPYNNLTFVCGFVQFMDSSHLSN